MCVCVYDRKILDILLNFVLPLCPYIILPYCGKDMIDNNNNRPISELFPSFPYTLLFNWVLKFPSLILFLLSTKTECTWKAKCVFPSIRFHRQMLHGCDQLCLCVFSVNISTSIIDFNLPSLCVCQRPSASTSKGLELSWTSHNTTHLIVFCISVC